MGALVADVHNVLINGGIYGYPSTNRNKNGKLRLLYESAPMSLIMEQAGGAGSTGHGRILDVKPTEIHHRYVNCEDQCAIEALEDELISSSVGSLSSRVPTFLGSTENVFELDQFYRYYGDDTVGEA
jgi:fructose-1,6-bisphosphatase I